MATGNSGRDRHIAAVAGRAERRLWARWGAWLEKYVKNPQKTESNKMTNDQALVVR